MTQKTLSFTKTKPTDLAKNGALYGCNIIKCGDKKFTIKNFQLLQGHDDSLPYFATLCLNKKPLCTCMNDGWGGLTKLTPINGYTDDNLKELSCELKQYLWKCGGEMKIELDLPFVADLLADSMA